MLDRVWTEWAATCGVSETVAAALFHISELRPLHEIVARLTSDEFKQVVEIVGRWPDHFRPGTLAALKDLGCPKWASLRLTARHLVITG
jgi:hypothetical protein